MLVLRGGPAFTAARLARRLRALSAKNPRVTGGTARHVYFVDVARALTEGERAALDRLLSPDPADDAEGRLFVVTPRLGTVSPWSTKATDIARSCGLGDVVRRIERGTAYVLGGVVDDAVQEVGPACLDRRAAVQRRTRAQLRPGQSGERFACARQCRRRVAEIRAERVFTCHVTGCLLSPVRCPMN